MLQRDSFIKLLAAGSALTLGMRVNASADEPSATTFSPNVWLRIGRNEHITIVLNKSEMGQGVATGLPTIVADELDASLDRVALEFAIADPRYNDPGRNAMGTGGSTSIRDMWMPLRAAGAAARTMLVAAAAQGWKVDPKECRTKGGKVFHDLSNRSATYGSLVAAAAAQPVPEYPPVKNRDQWTLIGKHNARLDGPAKVNGSARFGLDVKLPGMLYASVLRPPVFGGKLKTVDARKAKAIKGVRDVFAIPSGVAVVADNTWAAFSGKAALAVEWDAGPNAQLSTPALFVEAERLASGPSIPVKQLGDARAAQGTVIEATYRGPFLAHATMEPMNATADVRATRCEVWVPTQGPTAARAAAARVAGLPLEDVIVHTTFLGGGFGRRSKTDFTEDAVAISKRIGKPVKVVWSREDDIQHDFYRPMSLNVLRGVVGPSGNLVALKHTVVATALARWTAPGAYRRGSVDRSAVNQATPQYAIPNVDVSYVEHEHPIPVGNWRAPGANWNVFVVESFMDELAHAAKRDPLEFRLALLGGNPRTAGVLKLAAEKAGWGKSLPKGRANGIAFGEWNGSYAALVAQVSIANGMLKVHRATVAVDCGTVVNPDIVVAQVQSAVNYGLGAALTSKVTIQGGAVQQRNFYDYTVLRHQDAPEIDVHVVASTEEPTGIGEVGTPPIGPAVANAVFALTQKRVRSLPFSDALQA